MNPDAWAPAHWQRLSLGELTATTRPICYGVLKPGPDTPGGVPLLRIQDLKHGTVRVDRLHYISEELDAEFARSRLDGGEVLVSIQGTIGRIAICPTSLAGANISRTIAVIKPDDRVRPRFLAYYLRLVGEASAFPTQGATRASLNIGALRQLKIPAPSLIEQDRVVETIARVFSEIDTGERAFADAAVGCGRLRTALLAELAAPEFPRVAVGDVSQVFVGATPSRKSPDLWGGTVPWVSSGEVAFCRIDSTRETITEKGLGNPATRLHPPGTVLLAMIGEGKTRGQAAILDVAAAHNQNCASIRLDSSLMLPEFLFYCLMGQYERNRQAGSGSQQPALNGSLVRAIEVPCPALDIQRKLIAELEMRFAQEAKLSLNLRERVKESRELRESLLYCAFSGQLVLQHVEDEPGAALSRHIRDAGAAPPRPSARSRRAVLVRE